jgi:hypothetical protein
LKKNWRRTWPILILVRKASILLYLEWYWHSYGYESTKKKFMGTKSLQTMVKSAHLFVLLSR